MRTSITLPLDLKRRVDVFCKLFGLTFSGFAEQAFRLYLESEAREGRKLPKLPANPKE